MFMAVESTERLAAAHTVGHCAWNLGSSSSSCSIRVNNQLAELDLTEHEAAIERSPNPVQHASAAADTTAVRKPRTRRRHSVDAASRGSSERRTIGGGRNRQRLFSLPDIDRPLKYRLRVIRSSRSLSPSSERFCIRRVGRRFGNEEVFSPSEFEFLCDIGKGFYGVAKKVIHKPTGRILVLKEMLHSNKEERRTFEQELCLLRKIRHPNVLGFVGLNFDEHNSISFVVEYMAGGTLSEVIHNKDVELSWHRRIGFARDIAEGMKYLHSLNVIHRDLNSHNCLLGPDYTVVVADFGLSCAVGGEDTNYHSGRQRLRKPERYKIVGSPYWMAPEMLKIQKYDERVDVFSFGIVLCEIIGRVEADPDYLPRTSDFGLNVLLFKQKLCGKNCPKKFLEITVNCCDIDPQMRPAFLTLVPRLRKLYFSTAE